MEVNRDPPVTVQLNGDSRMWGAGALRPDISCVCPPFPLPRRAHLGAARAVGSQPAGGEELRVYRSE